MECSGNVDEAEVEGENVDDPSVDGGAGSFVGVIEHALDVPSIDFDNEVADANEPSLADLERAVQAVKFEFGLRVSRFACIQCD